MNHLIELTSVELPQKDITLTRAEVFDESISANAMRLHLTLLFLAKNEDWEFYVTGLATIFKVGRRTIERWIGELKQAGYLEITALRNARGRITGQYRWKILPCPKAEWIKRYKEVHGSPGLSIVDRKPETKAV